MTPSADVTGSVSVVSGVQPYLQFRQSSQLAFTKVKVDFCPRGVMNQEQVDTGRSSGVDSPEGGIERRTKPSHRHRTVHEQPVAFGIG